MTNNHRWITDIENIDDTQFPFSDSVLTAFEDRNYEKGKSFIGTVNLDYVAGCWHPDYKGYTWRELKPVPGTLNGDRNDPAVGNQILKRVIQAAQALEQNPIYYLDNEEKEHWSFYEYHGQYYIEAGMHRTVIGRYFLSVNNLPPMIRNVSITPCYDRVSDAPLPTYKNVDSPLRKAKHFIKRLFNNEASK